MGRSATIPGMAQVARWCLQGESDRHSLFQLRSDLSHETAAKFARLKGLHSEWKRGVYRQGDHRDAVGLLADLEAIYRRHSRIACQGTRSFLRIAGIVGSIRRLRRRFTPLRRGESFSIGHLEEIEREIAELDRNGTRLVEELSGRHAARLSDLVTRAADEIRRETAGGAAPQIPVLIERGEGHAAAWVPDADAATWLDIVRNIVRNGVDATRERSGGLGQPPPPVMIKLRTVPGRSATLLEIVDGGRGMTREEIDRAWTTGASTHGPRRGQGLTEGKREFVANRGTMEIRSAIGVGTAFAIDIPLRDLPLPRATVWSLRPVRALLLLIALGGGSMGATLLRTPAVDSVQIAGSSRIVARGENGAICWERDLRLRINRNYLAPSYTADDERDRIDSPLILRSPSGGARLIVLAMQPAQGPGQIWFLDARGRTRRSRTLPWTSPQGMELGKLNSVWQAAVPWTGDIEQAVVIQIRDNRYSPSATVFFSPEGDSIGAYYHWGQLQFHSASDLDMDGATEILLFGVANHAQHDRTVVPRDPKVYIDCIVMLEVPRVSGQAYPYSDWPGIPPAEEEAYLLLPPLFEGLRAEIRGIDVGSAAPGETPPIEIVLMDGRIYRLDSRLRPLSCATGDYTAARRMGVTRAMAPITYFREGRRESIDLPVQ